MVQGRPKGGKNRKYSPEEKLRIVKLHLNDHMSLPEIQRQEHVAQRNVQRWEKAYLENGMDGLKAMDHSKKGNPFSALHTSKSLSVEKRLRLENMRLRIENERLKKGYLVEGDGSDKEYVSIYEKITKSSKN